MYWSSEAKVRRRRVFLPKERSPHSSRRRTLLPASRRRRIVGVLLEERDSRGWVLKALREAGGSLVSEFYGVDADAMRECAATEEWCLAEVAGHVRDWEELAFLQISAVLDNERRLPIWDLESLPGERNYRDADVDDLLIEFRGLRRETADLLWGLRDHDWRREGSHPFRGKVSIEQIARELAQHDLEQLWRVRRIKHALGIDSRAREDDWR